MSLQSKQLGFRKMAGHGSIYAAGALIRQLVGFLMLPVYTRLLSPADYGVVGLMTFAVSIMELFFGARLGQAVPKYYFDYADRQKRSQIVSTAMIITCFVGFITTSVSILLRNQFSQLLFGSGKYATIVALFSALILTQAQEAYSLMYIRLQQRPWLFMGVSIAKLIIQLSLNIWLVVFMQMGVLGVAISGITSSALFAVLLGGNTLYNVGVFFDRNLGKKMFVFCLPLWIAGFANLYISSANRYFIRLFGSLDDVGLYELAAKFSVVIGLLLWRPFFQYWQVERFRYYKKNAVSVYQKVFKGISAILMIVGFGIAIFANPVIKVMAAITFYDAFKAVPFLVFAAIFDCFIIFFNFSFHVKEQTLWISKITYLTAVIVSFLYFSLIPLYGFVGAAVAIMTAKGIQTLITYRMSQRVYDMKIPIRATLMVCIVLGVITCIANCDLFRHDLWIDLIWRSFNFCLGCIIVLYPMWKNVEVRSFVIDLLVKIIPCHKFYKS